ncbi:piggyBac transposable element-derived protein 4-like [Seriola dumerili]|uniref:piggyBac transposable element-derived protein 4-like n=1 Tax=Seriola dumerili TaxID=41447 RepID=UPI000BBEDF86|nr:piggyBac transposable element-derived protein 4-like [Seriola dumerili]
MLEAPVMVLETVAAHHIIKGGRLRQSLMMESLRFNPKRTPGVQPPLNMGNPPPGEIFSHFFDAAVFKLLCENTNKNAAKNLEKGKKFIWTEITPDEMKKFIGMLLYMAVLKLPKISDFWRQQTIFHVSFPATAMSRDRFMAILSNLNGPKKNEENDKKKGTEDYDHLHRVRPLMELICVNCKAIYHPRQHLAVDERMVGTKARLSIKQYMKAKPTKWGLKFFVLADINGYTIDFMLYTGKSKWASGKGLSFDVVAGLVNKDYLGSGYAIYTDNFYTSPLLFRHLRQQGFGACGTYRQGRVGVPTTQENALTKKSPRGSIRWIRDRDLLFVKWMDVREVSLCSTIHPVYSGDTVERWSKTGDGPQQKISFPRPTSTRCASLQEKPMTRQRFQEELTAHLLGVDVKNGPQKTRGNQHLPIPTSSGHTKSDRASMGRRRCKLCKKSTAWQCQECDVGLCLQPERNCYWQHHQDL